RPDRDGWAVDTAERRPIPRTRLQPVSRAYAASAGGRLRNSHAHQLRPRFGTAGPTSGPSTHARAAALVGDLRGGVRNGPGHLAGSAGVAEFPLPSFQHGEGECVPYRRVGPAD